MSVVNLGLNTAIDRETLSASVRYSFNGQSDESDDALSTSIFVPRVTSRPVEAKTILSVLRKRYIERPVLSSKYTVILR